MQVAADQGSDREREFAQLSDDESARVEAIYRRHFQEE
jgi:hypothetical protein